MGHSQSKAEGNTISEYRPDYEVVKTTDDPNYGHIKLVREKKTHQQMILKDFVFNTKQAFEEELKFFRDRASADHAHIVQVIGYHTTQAQNLCSAHFKVAVFIEVLPNELQSSLKERTRNNRGYPESDVLLIAENVISALHHLKTKNMVHGDIRPVNIFISGQSYKVNDPRLESDKNSNALTKAIIEKTQTLLAPELLVKVPTGKFETKEDIAKADVFSLGATLLNVATLKRSEELYDYRTGKIDEHLLMDRLEEVRAKYSPFTYQLISDMLRIHEHDRPSFADLNQRLLPFHESIHRRADLHHDDHHGGGIVHHQGERVKKSALPVDHHHHDVEEVHTPQVDFHHIHHEPPQFQQIDTDDLDARIRAALQRSAETYKQVQFVDSQHVHGIESRPPVVTFGGPTTTEFSHVHTRQEEKPRHEEGERKLKSSVPGLGLEHHHSSHFGGHEGFRPSGGEHIVRSTPPAYTAIETHHHGHIGGTTFGHEGFRPTGGEHIVRSTPPAYTPIETHHHDHFGGTTFGHEGFRPTGGEHVVRSTLPAHTVTETQHVHIGEPTFGHEDEYVARTTYPAYIATELESGHIAVRQHGHIAEQAPRTSFTNPNNNVASFNYALGGSPQRQRTTFTTTSPGRDTQRTTYGQAPVVTQEYHFSADKGYHGTDRVEPGYPGVEVNEAVRPHTETERVVKAFHTGDDSANIHRVTYPSGSPAVNRYEITNIHDDYPRGNTVGYTGGYGAPAYGHENIQFGVENQGDGFRETGTSVHRFSHVEQGNNEDPLFESDPARYI